MNGTMGDPTDITVVFGVSSCNCLGNADKCCIPVDLNDSLITVVEKRHETFRPEDNWTTIPYYSTRKLL